MANNSVFPFRHQPIDSIKETVRDARAQPEATVQPAQIRIFPPHRFILSEAADDFLRLNEHFHKLSHPGDDRLMSSSGGGG
ncbi:MAG: hypothetical protein QM706_20295 [Nitrospira sp.]